MEVCLKAQVVFGGICHRRLTGALYEGEAVVATPASGVVVRCALCASGSFADDAGRRELAGDVLVSTAAAAELLGERAQLVVLGTIQERLQMTQPVGLRPAGGNARKETKGHTLAFRFCGRDKLLGASTYSTASRQSAEWHCFRGQNHR